MRLEELTVGAVVRGLTPEGIATIASVTWFGEQAVDAIYRDAAGKLGSRILYRTDEPSLELAKLGRPWAFDGDGHLFRLVSEAYRIRLAHLFDPFLALTTSTVDALPHQILAVYQEMLPRQPLRFLLADDPGAGKTIMTGLLIRELLVRGDLERCLIIAPGSLTDQWRDELSEKFGLEFNLLTREHLNGEGPVNPFDERNRLIARLDQLSRNTAAQQLLRSAREWDLIVCDEAHRMSAHFEGSELKPTKRYRLGQVVGNCCRNLLLLTATPHNGKEEDFQLFLALLDGDRFEGRYREGVHTTDPSDLMRRMVKEELRRFDGRPLFPERRSYTPQYPLTAPEAELYAQVTKYVCEEMNRAERAAAAEGDQQRRVNVGFALMILQRRLASSPEAIYRSIIRRRERLEARLQDERELLRDGEPRAKLADLSPKLDEEEFDEIYDEAPQEEREEIESTLVDLATAARTVKELEEEIARLRQLEVLARRVRLGGQDAKWAELNTILDGPLMVDTSGQRRKLVIFTEFRDTLEYVAAGVRRRIGRDEAVVEIHGGVRREDRRARVHSFMNDPTVLVLVANDAAGEGVNLHRAHLMVNYDLPWNPNRLEQRFGRIHRIGQEEICHLWNLVAEDTREGEVYVRLLEKIEVERKALGGKVFDVLGDLFEDRPLRELLMEAVRYGDDPRQKAKLHQTMDMAADREHLERLLERRALVHDSMDLSAIAAIREEIERAHARRLQPHYIQSFFAEAFGRLGGQLHRREPGRFEITQVPALVRDRDQHGGTGAPVARRYERVCFEKDQVEKPAPRAVLLCPGTPLFDATLELTLEQLRGELKRGAVLVDEQGLGEEPRLLFYLEHMVQDGRRRRDGRFQAISMQLQFVEAGPVGRFQDAGTAPYLDYRPASEAERRALKGVLEAEWLCRDWENQVLGFAIRELVPKHVEEVRARRLPLVEKTEQEVRARLQKEIYHWDGRAQELKAQERAGKQTRLPAQVAQERANHLAERLQLRLAELKLERAITPQTPGVQGGALVVPIGLLRRLGAAPAAAATDPDAEERKRIEQLAMEAVMAAERALDRTPRDVHRITGIGYDLESRDNRTGRLFFVEVKGIGGAPEVSLTRSEILCALNEPEQWRLAVVLVDGDQVQPPVYVRGFDFGQPVFGQTSAAYSLSSILAAAGPPS